jgi:peptidoglycan/xylan/chitin deacetylase (PgdA/CDA1 family)
MTLPKLAVHVDVPAEFEPRAQWALDTMLAPLGRRAALTRDPAQSAGAALAYAGVPVEGVPTIPCNAAALELFAAGRPLPAGAFAVRACRAGSAVAAFPADPGAGFAFPFDLVASAFVLLACWDERTTAARDKFGRLPYDASVFAANPSLRIDDPAVDRYVELLREALAPRLAELGLERLPSQGWVWGEARPADTRFAVALTHDLDNLWRWTRRGFAAAGYRTARAVRRGDGAAARREIGDGADWLVRHLPRRTDPFWTFPLILDGEDARGVSSTFFVIARHTHKQDGNQPETYRRRIPEALDLVRAAGREVGLHGNDADRLGVGPLVGDRDDLQRRAGGDVTGIRYHYLRALYHETLPYLEAAGFGYDTSLAFAEHEGYRCGCSFPFRPYALAGERPLDLIELPLAVMDGTLQEEHYRALAAPDAEHAAAAVLARALRSGGAVSLLWHNNRFDRRVSRGYDEVYWHLLDQALAHGAWCGRAADIVARWREATS